jgi:hypothetical protein
MSTESPTRHLADVLVNGVEKYVRDRRQAGLSWRRIALELRDSTDAKVDVTHETLRSWFADRDWARVA